MKTLPQLAPQRPDASMQRANQIRPQGARWKPSGAMLGAALTLGLSGLVLAPARANYLTKATQATDYIQRAFYDPKAGLYRAASPADPKALPYDFMWANGLQFSVLTQAARYQPAKYRAPLYAFTKGLEKYWDRDAAVPGFDAYFSSPNGDDKYYDDNAWLVLDFVEAYDATQDARFLDWARRTQHFVLSGYDQKLGGGLYWHQQKRDSKNTCINAPAAASALELYRISGRPEDLSWAQGLYTWTNLHLQDKDGLFFDNLKLDGTIEKTKWTYNSALMLRSNIGLWRALKDPKYLREAQRISDAALARWVQPGGAFRDDARFNNWLSEALLLTYQASGDLRYLNAVRRHADFGYRFVRDARDGGYFDHWKAEVRAPTERKTLIENAGAARIFWLLASYPDVEELQARSLAAQRRGDTKKARDLSQQARDSTAGAA